MTPQETIAIAFVLLAIAYSIYIEIRLSKAHKARTEADAARHDVMLRHEARLVAVLQQIQIHDKDYPARYLLVLRAMALAEMAGYAAGYRIDPLEPEWPVAYIQLPTGQVSWHMPQFADKWDGHTTQEKYSRIGAYVRGTIVDAIEEHVA